MGSWTESDVVALEQAIKAGVKEVYFGDKRVVYHSLSEMMRLLDVMRKEVGIADRNSGRKLAEFNKGL
jgi:collagenase-like PrtC family protease